ncbi:MAG: FtsW/RodA/SpoVE family cell cycle protein, partial [Patescibacteria group bacterium]
MKKGHQPDYFLILIIFLLLFIGLYFLNSASAVIGYKNFNDPFYYLKLQILQGVLPGLFLFFIFSFLPIKILEKWAYLLFFIGFLLLIFVFITGLGLKYKEAQRWINLRIFSFQPIEVFKFVFILFLARFFSHREKEINNFYLSFLPFIFILAIISLPIIFQPNIGSLLIIFLIAFSIYFLAGASIFYIISLIILGFSIFL